MFRSEYLNAREGHLTLVSMTKQIKEVKNKKSLKTKSNLVN